MPQNFKRKTRASENRLCYLRFKPDEFLSGAFNPKVSIETLKIIENPNYHNSTFIFRNGETKLKESHYFPLKSKTFFKVFVPVFLLFALSFLHKDISNCLSFGFFKNYSLSLNENHFLGNLKKEIRSKLYTENILAAKKDQTKREIDSNLSSKSEDFLIRSITKDLFLEAQREYKFRSFKKSSRPFIEEQCSDFKKKMDSVDTSLRNDTMWDLNTDYALESQGAKILSVFNTDQYGIITIKFLNFSLHHGVSDFLMKYFKVFSSKGPTSILIPWKKPGDCWAFKGQKGRVQIQLSEPVIISAVTIDHMPKQFTHDSDIQSAPKEFFVLGVKKFKEDFRKIHLGKFEFSNGESGSQTFYAQPKLGIFFEIIEIAFESNHGNEAYTCIYKVRVHGHK